MSPAIASDRGWNVVHVFCPWCERTGTLRHIRSVRAISEGRRPKWFRCRRCSKRHAGREAVVTVAWESAGTPFG